MRKEFSLIIARKLRMVLMCRRKDARVHRELGEKGGGPLLHQLAALGRWQVVSLCDGDVQHPRPQGPVVNIITRLYLTCDRPRVNMSAIACEGIGKTELYNTWRINSQTINQSNTERMKYFPRKLLSSAVIQSINHAMRIGMGAVAFAREQNF